MRWFPAFLLLASTAGAATDLRQQVADLTRCVHLLAAKEPPVLRAATLRRLQRLLAGQPDPLPDPKSPPATAAGLLDRLEHSPADPAGYDALAALVRLNHLSTGTDNPSVRARIALADLADLLVTDYDQALPALRPYRGQTVIVTFWATWCGPCQAELPLVEKLHRDGVPILAVTAEPVAVIEEFMKCHAWSFPAVSDPDRRAFTKFGVEAMPATRVIDPQGRLSLQTREVDEAVRLMRR